MEFCPEAQCNDYDLKSFKMWKYYKPTLNWTIAGPIIEKEGICISYQHDECGKRYAWSFYLDNNGNDSFEIDADTGTESAMRSYVMKHFGEEVDMDNLPKIQRAAIVKINGLTKPLHAIEDDEFADAFFEQEVEVEVETAAEAERKVLNMFPHLFQPDTFFVKWK